MSEKRIEKFRFKVNISPGGNAGHFYLTTDKCAEELRKEIFCSLIDFSKKHPDTPISNLINSRSEELKREMEDWDLANLMWLPYELDIDKVFYMKKDKKIKKCY